MPENQQGNAQQLRMQYIEMGVVAGSGVLLLFLATWSNNLSTSVFSLGIAALLFYSAFVRIRRKWKRATTSIDDEAVDMPQQQIERELYSETIQQKSYAEAGEQHRDEPKRRQRFYHAADFLEETPTVSMSNLEPQSEFNNLLIKALHAIKEVCFAHTVAFFWVNNETNQLVIEAKITESSGFTTERKIGIGTDAVSRIAVGAEPELVNDISSESERDLLCYYRTLQDVRSFIGVPVFYVNDMSAQHPVAVIAVDSKARDAFGEETFSTLSQFSKLISAMLMSYTEKYDLLSDMKLVEADKQLMKKISNRPNVAVVVNSFVEELENVIPWDTISVVLLDESQHRWAIASANARVPDRFVSPKQAIDFEKSIVGAVIRTSTLQHVDLEKNSSIVFHDGEADSSLLKKGSLVAVPLISNGKCFGAAVISNTRRNTFAAKEIAAIQFLASTAAPALEIIELNSIVNEHVIVDELTGTMTKKYFLSRLEEELHRATDRTEDLSLVLVSVFNVSDIESRYGAEGKNGALVNVGSQLRASVRQYDIVARYDDSTFALVLADTVASDAFLWAEKVRASISSTIITVDKKSFSVSVTIGVSGAAARMPGEELLKNASFVLDQAKRAGGNIVRVF